MKLEKSNISIAPKLNTWAPTCTSIGFSTIGGSIFGGTVGGTAGLITGIADEYLIAKGAEDKHYLSSTAFWSATTVYPLLTSLTPLVDCIGSPLTGIVSIVSGFTLAYFTDDFFNFKEKLNLPLESFLTINQFFDSSNYTLKDELQKISETLPKNPTQALSLIKNNLNGLYQNEFLMHCLSFASLSVLNVIIDTYLLTQVASYGNTLFITNWVREKGLSPLQGQSSNPLNLNTWLHYLASRSSALWEGTNIIGLLCLKLISQFAISERQNFLSIKLSDHLTSKSANTLLEDDNGRKILATENGEKLIQYFAHDLFILLYNGVHKLDTTITELFSVLFSAKTLVNMDTHTLFPYILFVFPLQKALFNLGEKSKKVAEDYMTNHMQLWSTLFSISNNIQEIQLRDGASFIKHQYNELSKTNSELTVSKTQTELALKKLEQLSNIIHYFPDMFFTGFHIVNNQLALSQLPLFKDSINKIYHFLSSNLYFQINNKDLILAKTRVDELLEIIRNKKSSSQVNRTNNSENKVLFKDYTLSLDGNEIIRIDQLEFDTGKCYAITGKSGCGKSSLLIDLKIGLHGSLLSKGEISIFTKESKPAKTVFLDQSLYLPRDCSLLKSIYFPGNLDLLTEDETLKLKNKVISLFNELEINRYFKSIHIYLFNIMNSTQA
ncbi:MAG: hypothetical protein S4CHLAM7_15500 [Chlamydiae bacterium]|nr:hypothetical protein [Chlamydiota bacterium]